MSKDMRTLTVKVPSWLWWGVQAHADEAKTSADGFARTLIEDALTAIAAGAGPIEGAMLVDVAELPDGVSPAELAVAAGLEQMAVRTFIGSLIAMGFACWCEERRIAAEPDA